VVPYRWTCNVCGEVNAENTGTCATCGFKAIASGAEIRRAREAWKATGSIHGQVPERPLSKYRTFWPRFWAGLIDALLFVPLAWLDHEIWQTVDSRLVLVPWFIVESLAWCAYSIVLHGLRGQTLGKQLTGVKVLDISESKLTMKQAVLRDALPVLLTAYGLIHDLPTVVSGGNPYDRTHDASAADVALAFGANLWFFLEVATMLWNEKRRALHDFIAGSVVVRVDRRPVQIHADSAPS
jgi:uncharacterized RDD family membrane protein YckC